MILRKSVACAFPVLLTVLLVVPFGIRAQESHPGNHSGAHAFHRNHVSGFVGSTTVLKGHRHSRFTLGFDYERRLVRLAGISLVGEYLPGAEAEFIVGLQPVIHPYKGLKCYVSPLLLVAHEAEEINGHPSEHKIWHDSLGVRFGAAWDFHFGQHFIITPELNYDSLGSHSALVYGMAFGLGF